MKKITVADFITESTNAEYSPLELGFDIFHCSKGSLYKKVYPKLRRVLKSYDPSAKVTLTHRTLLKPGVRGVKHNFHVITGKAGSTPISIVLDSKYKEVIS